MDTDLCASRISRYMERELIRRNRSRGSPVCISRRFLLELKREFGGEDNVLTKIAKLKRVEQEGKIIEELVQEFRRVAKKSRYERRVLVEKFKRKMNKVIRIKLIEAEKSSRSIN